MAHARLVLIALVITAILPAQQNLPHAGYIYPAGGRQGSTFEAIVGGQFLDSSARALFSGKGVEGTALELIKPMPQNEVNKLREQVKELTDRKTAKKDWIEADEKRLAEIRERLAKAVIRPANPTVGEVLRLRVRVADDAAPGRRELRLVTPAGLTNPLFFEVGQLPEVARPAAKVILETYPAGSRPRKDPTAGKEGPADVTLPAVLNGQILPGTVDRYRFNGTKGQNVVIATSARELRPYISDAVPGWFQATVTVYDAKGKELAYAGNYRFHPDPVAAFEIPADGMYTLEIRDSIYRGREDFVYRIAVGELPFLASVFPLGGKAGKRTAVEASGWNLGTSRIPQDLRRAAEGVHVVAIQRGGQWSNPLPFQVSALPEVMDREGNDSPKKAQKLKLPVVVNGRIDRPGDMDVFRIDGRAGEQIVAEVWARRLGSPLDSMLVLSDSAGRQLAANDDEEDKGSGLLTHQADSRISFRLPSKGAYYLRLIDAQHKGGQDYAYRLRVDHPRPDFALRVAPCSLNARPGSVVPITVYALRRDGFEGDIALELKGAPAGFALSGAWVPSGQDKVRTTLTVPPVPTDGPLTLSLEGCGSINGRKTCHPAVPAEDMMQAFAYHHLVPVSEWMVQVGGPVRSKTPWKLASDAPMKLKAEPGEIRLTGPIGPRQVEQIRLVLNEPPEGIVIDGVTPANSGGFTIRLHADPRKAKPGLKGNLIVDAFLEVGATAGAQPARAQRRRSALGVLPAIPFEVGSF